MSAAKDEEYCQTYLNKLDDEEEDGEQFEDDEVDDAEVSDSDKDDDNKGSIIIDEEGNYYYQTSQKVFKIERLKKGSEIPVKKITSAVVSANNGKNTAQIVPHKKAKVKSSTISKVKQEANAGIVIADEIIVSGIISQKKYKCDSNISAEAEPVSPKKAKVKSGTVTKIKQEANDTKTADDLNIPEISSQEVYEFDESVEDADDPGDVADPDYKSKGIIKEEGKPASKEAPSFTCTTCSYQTNKKFLLTRHLKTHLGDRPYKCTVCERGFKSNATLLNHRNVHLGYRPHACQSCDMSFTTSGELVRHQRYRHTHIKPYMCTECDYCCVEMSKLRRHMRCHTGERPYQCPHCTYASPDTFKLKRHIRVHTGEKPYECDICYARFTQSNSLKNHRLIHSVYEKPVFQCHLCPSTCGRKVDLRLHIKKLHTSEHPIPCKRCGKELPDRYSYKMHIKTHDGEKFFRCEYCPYASISKRHLETHLLIHFDAKPFICEICQSSFRQKPLLTRHMKIYHEANYEPPAPRKKVHKCPHCNKMFARNGNLIRHMEIHDPTSRMLKEKEELKNGRMKRVKPDGTIVTVMNPNEEEVYEESEEQHQIDDEFQKDYVESEVYNEDNIQYVYGSEAVEYKEQYQEEEDDEEEFEKEECEEEEYEQQFDESSDNGHLLDVKEEKSGAMNFAQTTFTDTANTKDKDNKDSQIEILDINNDDDYMVIEFLPDDDDDEKETQENDDELQTTKSIENPTATNISGNKDDEKHSNKKSQRLISDYFGFEVNTEEEDDGNEEIIQLLEIIDDD